MSAVVGASVCGGGVGDGRMQGCLAPFSRGSVSSAFPWTEVVEVKKTG